MNLTRCSSGHYYDASQYAQCPHCGNAPQAQNETISYHPEGPAGETVAVNQQPASSHVDDDATVGFFEAKEGVEPVVGWLICISKGRHYGKSFDLKAGKNFIGRAKGMDVQLDKEESVSRERHAIVVFEPKQSRFLAQAGESSELFYVNGEVVLETRQLKKNDQLHVGKVTLMLIPCCDEAFSWLNNVEGE